MPSSTPFRLNRTGLLLALITTAFAGEAEAAAGRVEFAVGPATVVGTDGRTRPAARGTELDTGDVVRTNDGRVQMRMADGAYISLQPNTEFGIKDYKYEGKTDGSENALFSLVKGAMRTVTGLIGRINRNKFLVTTPTATIGIRGTGGLIEILQDGATLVQGTSGIWYLANPAGSIDIPAGVSGIAPVDPKQPPRETVQIPTAGPSPLPALLGFVQGDLRILLSGDGYAADLRTGAQRSGAESAIGSAMFNGSGQLVHFEPTAPLISTGQLLLSEVQVTPTNTSYTLLSGSRHADFGTDGILAWGRWIDNVSIQGTTVTYNENQGLHYVVGLPTVLMPLIGTASYSLLGATRPTYTDGSATPGSFSGSLNVDFARLTVGLALNVGIDSKNYSVGGDATIFGSAFSGSSSLTVSELGGGCGSGCSASVVGFFGGADAVRAGLGYSIFTDTPKTIEGSAAFAKQ
jgi:hypothetical protein